MAAGYWPSASVVLCQLGAFQNKDLPESVKTGDVAIGTGSATLVHDIFTNQSSCL